MTKITSKAILFLKKLLGINTNELNASKSYCAYIMPSVEKVDQEQGLLGAFKMIEKVGRVCYNSEDKITETSYKPFVEKLTKMKHLSVLEFGTIYLEIKKTKRSNKYIRFFYENPYSKVVSITSTEDNITMCYITTNYRVLVENDLEKAMNRFICSSPKEVHKRRVCFSVGTSIAISREGTRHRTLSTCERSTRYVCFNKEKYNYQVPICIPEYLDIANLKTENKKINDFIYSTKQSSKAYLDAIKDGVAPQDARDMLPLATYTRLYWCAFEDDWHRFIVLRNSKNAHPSMRRIAENIQKQLTK